MSGRRILVLGGTLSGPTAAARAREIDESSDITIIQGGAHLSFAFAGLAHYLSGEVADLSQRQRRRLPRFCFDTISSAEQRIKQAAKIWPRTPEAPA